MQDLSLLTLHFIRFSQTTVGRDKLYRFVQYFSRFLVYFWESNSTKNVSFKSKVLKTQLLIKHLSLARKLLRIGRPIEYFHALKTALNDRASNIGIKLIHLSKSTLLSIWMYYDFLLWLQGVGIYKPKQPQLILRRAYQYWLFGLVFGFTLTLNQCRSTYLKQKMLCLEKESPLLSTIRIHGQQFIQEALDMWVPAKGLQWLPLNEGIIGLSGAFTSLLGAETQWNKVNLVSSKSSKE